MYFRHDIPYEYPEKSDEHMITVKCVKRVCFDKSYPFFNKSFGFKLLRAGYFLLVNLIVFPFCRLTHGFRIYGKKNLKKHKKTLKGGAISISNHVFYFDFLCVLRALRPRLVFFPAWKDNFEGPLGGMIRLSGGIPVPTDSAHAMAKFNAAMEEILKGGKWLHVFPEGSMWFFYPDIRPLKKAVFSYAVRFDKPILPITLSFRPRRGITRWFTKKPFVDVHIGEPLFHDKSLSPREAERELHARAYHVMQEMNGIHPGDPTYNTDQNIAHYQKTM